MLWGAICDRFSSQTIAPVRLIDYLIDIVYAIVMKITMQVKKATKHPTVFNDDSIHFEM